jgi:hypothetical protein
MRAGAGLLLLVEHTLEMKRRMCSQPKGVVFTLNQQSFYSGIFWAEEAIYNITLVVRNIH